MQAEPNFVDIENLQYDLQANSELIDKGVYIPGVNDAYKGTAPDIGAYEYASDIDIDAYDLNLDGQVNSFDLKELLLDWSEKSVGLREDFNNDEVVNSIDFGILLNNISK